MPKYALVILAMAEKALVRVAAATSPDAFVSHNARMQTPSMAMSLETMISIPVLARSACTFPASLTGLDILAASSNSFSVKAGPAVETAVMIITSSQLDHASNNYSALSHDTGIGSLAPKPWDIRIGIWLIPVTGPAPAAVAGVGAALAIGLAEGDRDRALS
jgi:hypothetical protein